MEMLHRMLKYSEVGTNLNFNKVSEFPLEIRAGIVVDSYTVTEDGANVIAVVDAFRRLIGLE